MATDSQNSPAGRDRLPREVIEDILASERRRVMLSCLENSGGPVAVTDLAAAVGAHDGETTPVGVDEKRRRAVREDIYERHLPKLTATGAVEYDSMCGTVRLVEDGLARELE
jgi:hypothetical protein